MNWVFVGFLVAVGVGGYRTWRRTRGDAERTRETKVPGYSVTSGAEFGVEPDVGLIKGDDWEASLIETFHSRGRSRIVVTIDVAESAGETDVEELLRECAREVASRSRANVSYVEAYADSDFRGAVMWSPDGRGWNGVDARSEIVVGREQ